MLHWILQPLQEDGNISKYKPLQGGDSKTCEIFLPGDEVIQGQAQDRQEQEHGKGPAVPSSIHVNLEPTGNNVQRL